MSITRKDILDHARGTSHQLEMYEYWNEKDPRLVTPLEMVREYHKTAGLDLDFKIENTSEENVARADKDRDWGKKAAELADLRLKLMEEEFEEALEAKTTENQIKELADLVYVIYGCAATFGWDLDEAVRRVHENNMGRMYQDDGTIKRREDGKILRNKNYPNVDLSDLV